MVEADASFAMQGVSDEERSRAGLRQKDAKSEEDEEGPSDSEVRPEPQSFRKYVTFESCSPWEEETLSVFGFEVSRVLLPPCNTCPFPPGHLGPQCKRLRESTVVAEGR